MKLTTIKYTLIMAVSLSFSCRQESKPERVLSHQEMVSALAEIYMTEEKISRLALSNDSAAKVIDLFRDNIAEKTGIPDSTFRRSMEYYAHRPQELEKIYTILIDTLHLREQRAASRIDSQ